MRLVSARWGDPSDALPDQHLDPVMGGWVTSPYGTDELGALPPADAARRASAWRPDPDAFASLVGARELARVVEELTTADPEAWTEHPLETVTLLREPVYVLHYQRGLTSSAARLGERAPAVLDAAEYCRTARPAPTPLGSDDGYNYESTWNGVDSAIVEVIEALANADGVLLDRLDWAWDRVLAAARDRPNPAGAELVDIVGDRDAYHSAINRPWSRALRAAAALARWEDTHVGSIRAEFVALFDEVLVIDGAVGLEYRAILAARRTLLEALVPDWLDDHIDLLFRDDPHGVATLDLMLRWSRPTDWLLDRLRNEIYAAVARRADRALSCVLIAALNQHPD